jgi:hypothetical protein
VGGKSVRTGTQRGVPKARGGGKGLQMTAGYRQGLWLTVIATLAGISGCTPQLYGYETIKDSDRYIPDKTLNSIVEQKLTREDVVRQLGEPDGTNATANTIGYERCVSSKGWGVFGSAGVEDCQRVVIWFSDQDRARAQRSLVQYTAYDQSGFIYSFDEWLAAQHPIE